MTSLFYVHLILVWFVDAAQTDICTLTDIGVNKTDHGPVITVQPVDAIYDPGTTTTRIVMSCKANANPMASYVWYVQQSENRRPVNLNDPNITVTAGSLMIAQPSETLHGGSYQCVASNCFGSVMSNAAQLSFSYLNNFPRSIRDPVQVTEYTGVAIECLPPKSGYSELLYSWFKDTLDVPVSSDVKWNTFASNDGKLYFQFATVDDAGNYYCVVRRPSVMGDIQDGKVSMPIPLRVVQRTSSDQELVITNSFPKSFPLSPKTGDEVRVECFAFGTTDGRRPDGLTLIPWYKGRNLVWDATVIDTVASSYVQATSVSAGAAAEVAATRKVDKYNHLMATYLFVPLAFETMGPINIDGLKLLKVLGRLLTQITGDPKESSYLFQRISVCIQRFNAVACRGTFEKQPQLSD